MIIGITGEICSGKSTVAKILRQYKDFFYINVDDIARYIVEPGQKAYHEIVDYFGEEVLKQDKTIDRFKLGEEVFSDQNKLQKLNEITHKYIYKEVKILVNKYRFADMFDEFNLIIDAALLYEIRLHSLIDSVWYVEADKQIRLERLMKRSDFTKEQAIKRIESQKISKNKDKANKIIYNNGSKEVLKNQVLSILRENNLLNN